MYIPEIELKPQAEIKRFQEGKLQELLQYLSENSAYYQRFFKTHQVDITEIKTLEDLQKIPTTTKDDLQKYNNDFLCVPKNKIIDYLTTSGTAGDPVVFAETENDLQRLAYNEYISFVCATAKPDDIFQLMVTLDRRFMAGMAYYEGIRKLGAGVVRVGPGNPGLQFDTIERIKPTALVTVPSFLLKLIDYAEQHHIDYQNSSIKKAVCIGESLRNEDFSLNTLGQRIKEKWDIELYSTYASTEMGTAFTDCEFGMGGHHHPEMIIVEFLDDEGNPVPPGTPGEVTITTLGVEGMPLLRFKTGDICNHFVDKCKCGRTTTRLGSVIGRKNQMIKYKGTTLYPPALYDVLNDIENVENYMVCISKNTIGTDDIEIKVGTTKPGDVLKKEVKDCFRAKLRVAPDVTFYTPAEILKMQFPEMSRKPITFVDNRN
ncbi:phenylacetate--CoA ligase family protein [Plebeiibacterium sediminum]|uniref:AMP-binding protein n=1 Tax=Plebeiibacterium sediminum TaxID=2992112 RepID=A0AAE3SDS5_9BACT|nr:AMP-binding protein [Plebeiobacterium sediminum]MCW3785565.1 AMP-binding protein [Plebeiobacterium sediminum]